MYLLHLPTIFKRKNEPLEARDKGTKYTIFQLFPYVSDERERQNQECIFRKCVEGVDTSDLVVAILDGVDVDSGTAWEIGYAYAKGKPVIGLRTDFRALSDGVVNLMVEMAIVSLARDEDELLKVTEKFR